MKLAIVIEIRLWELDKNLELTTKDIFDILCQEYQLNADSIETALSCKCPFGLTGFLKELENSELTEYLECRGI
ncbi:hypothetical protein [Nostoc sp. CCY 9925]|uniref:hypothetical protein n=1 Tax=Nostoc sp. CCY 9925 TaxID=3103865 RepID=UPI0039C601E1